MHPQTPPFDQADLICGVSRPVVERFLILIRDYYAAADKASFFMEEHGHKANTTSIANLRDVLSHMATMLDPSTPSDKKEEQVASAEEHIRRAILEPYAIVIGKERQEVRALWQRYEQELLPAKNTMAVIKDAPGIDAYANIIKEVARLVSSGRSAKRLNIINPQWESGVKDLVVAYDILTTFHSHLRSYWNLYISETNKVQLDQFQKRNAMLGILNILLLALVMIVGAFLITSLR